jgi:hypothetical protein
MCWTGKVSRALADWSKPGLRLACVCVCMCCWSLLCVRTLLLSDYCARSNHLHASACPHIFQKDQKILSDRDRYSSAGGDDVSALTACYALVTLHVLQEFQVLPSIFEFDSYEPGSCLLNPYSCPGSSSYSLSPIGWKWLITCAPTTYEELITPKTDRRRHWIPTTPERDEGRIVNKRQRQCNRQETKAGQ